MLPAAAVAPGISPRGGIMPRVWLLLLAVAVVSVAAAAGHRKAATPPAACGTCTSLGYICVRDNTTLKDNCGKKIAHADCPVPDCNKYCRLVLHTTQGACDDGAHVCSCANVTTTTPAEALQQVLTPPTAVAAATTPSDCTPTLTCANMKLAAWKCIPPNTIDACGQIPIPVNFCGAALPTCDTQCKTPLGNSTCLPGGLKCQCGTGKIGSAGSKSPPGKVVAQTLDTSPSATTRLTAADTIITVSQAITIGVVSGVLILVLIIALIVAYVKRKRLHTYVRGTNQIHLVRA